MKPLFHILATLAIYLLTTLNTLGADSTNNILGEGKQIALSGRFETLEAVSASPVTAGSGYGTVVYSIGSGSQREYVTRVIQYIASTLPEKFGNSSGTYTITVSVKDRNGKQLAREPIVSFSWTKESGFLFIEKTVSEVLKASWKGTLINRMPIRLSNEKLRIEIEMLFQKDRSLDFELVKKAAKTFSDGTLASLAPMPAAAVPAIGAIGDLVKALYDGSEKRTLVEQDEVAFMTEPTVKTSKIKFTDRNGASFDVPVLVTFATDRTRLAPLQDGKFDPISLSQSIASSEYEVGDGKSVSILELIATSDNATTKLARPLIESLITGKDYGKDAANNKENDVNFRCSALYESFHLYLSQLDARAMFWAFLQKYGDKINRGQCLGSRASELGTIGLKF
jgi:hypothetical protein